VYLDPILESRERRVPEIVVGSLLKSGQASGWWILGDGTFCSVRGMKSGFYAAFHLLQLKGYMKWEDSC
jgi:hypothetical protein